MERALGDGYSMELSDSTDCLTIKKDGEKRTAFHFFSDKSPEETREEFMTDDFAIHVMDECHLKTNLYYFFKAKSYFEEVIEDFDDEELHEEAKKIMSDMEQLEVHFQEKDTSCGRQRKKGAGRKPSANIGGKR